jgi:UDP-glucose:(heptosyl)LPS alpha-1,3-glucosyltransferase
LRVAFGIVRLFPEGGLQRDCVRLARLMARRGHDVTIFTAMNRWGAATDLSITLLPVDEPTNHGTDWAFARKFVAATAGKFDRIVGFNKLTGLDVLYCADPPVAQRRRYWWQRVLPRYRARLRLEGESFRPDATTHIVALTNIAAANYRRHWGLRTGRFTVMPPGLDDARRRPELREPSRRQALRAALGVAGDQPVWLWIGAQPRTKGLDRALKALATQPNAVLLVVGVTNHKGAGAAAAVQARWLGVAGRVRFLGFREDVANLLAAADVLVHPARLDVSGQVILEALVNGLPSIVTGCCGFAEHVREAGSGIVLPEPFAQADLNAAVVRIADPALAAAFSKSGIDYGHKTVPRDGLIVAADVIEQATGGRRGPAPAPTG